MSLRVLGIFDLLAVLSCLLSATPKAGPFVASPILSIGSLGVVYDDTTKTITITEDWTSSLMGSLLPDFRDSIQVWITLS